MEHLIDSASRWVDWQYTKKHQKFTPPQYNKKIRSKVHPAMKVNLR